MERRSVQVQAVMDAMAEYIKVDLIPKHPAACHELGTHVYPQLHMEGELSASRMSWRKLRIPCARLFSLSQPTPFAHSSQARPFLTSLSPCCLITKVLGNGRQRPQRLLWRSATKTHQITRKSGLSFGKHSKAGSRRDLSV